MKNYLKVGTNDHINAFKCENYASKFFFAGNVLVIFVILRHRKMRTVTNFFLANLAAADLCVGIFCVLPNLSQNLSPAWVLGRVSTDFFSFYCIGIIPSA